MTTEEKMRQEAVARMVQLKMKPSVIRDFQNGILNISQNGGMTYHLDTCRTIDVKRFENYSGCLVYHLIRSRTSEGELITMLYVSDEPKSWPDDSRNLDDGHTFAYVLNIDNPFGSEYGTVTVEPKVGGLVRTV